MYAINLYNIGKPAEQIKVFDLNTGRRRTAQFSTLLDAQEACLIIRRLRSDSAFEGTEIIELPY